LSFLARQGWALKDISVGAHYGRIVANGFRALSDSPGVWSGPGADTDTPDRREAARRRLERMTAALWLPGEGSLVFHTTRATVLDQIWADWLKRYVLGKPWPQDGLRLDALREGLRRLRDV
jgi:hypothetical protein